MKVFLLALFLCTQVKAGLISTSPAITETLFALGLGDKVRAVSDFCLYPAEAKKLPKVGTTLKMNWEKIVQLKGDTLLLQSLNNERTLKKAQKLKLDTKQYPFTSLKDIESSIFKIGKDFKKDPSSVLSPLKSWRQKLGELKSEKTFLAVIFLKMKKSRAISAMVVGRHNHYDNILGLTGMKNAVQREGYLNWNRETLLKTSFDYLVIFNKDLRENPLIDDKIGKTKRVILVNGEATDTVGPRVYLVMKEVYEKLATDHK